MAALRQSRTEPFPRDRLAGTTGLMNLPLMSAQNNQPLSAGAGFRVDTSASGGILTLTFSAADTYPLEIDGAFVPNFDVAPLGAAHSQGLEFAIYNQSAQGGGTPTGLIYIQSGSSGSGINSVIGRNYWYDNADQTVGVATESSSSPITPQSSGPLINGSVAVYQQPGLFFSSTTRTTVTGGNSTDNPGPVNPQINGSMVGQALVSERFWRRDQHLHRNHRERWIEQHPNNRHFLHEDYVGQRTEFDDTRKRDVTVPADILLLLCPAIGFEIFTPGRKQ